MQSIRWTDLKTKERYTYLTPPGAQQAIIRWDQGYQLQPFTFELHTPQVVRRMRSKWTGSPQVLKQAWAKQNAKRKALRRAMTSPISPRLVKSKKQRVGREREFGVRKLSI